MRLCKDSTNPPSQGWPGGMNACSVLCSLAQPPTAAAMNSGPVIGAQHLGCTTCQDSQVKHVDHVDGSHAPLNAQSQVLARELNNDVTDLKDTPLPVRVELEINGPHLPRSASPHQVLQVRRGAGLVGFARSHAQSFGAPQAPERITPHNNALTLGPRPGTFIAPPSMRGGKIVHPLAYRPMITQRFHPARRADAAIR